MKRLLAIFYMILLPLFSFGMNQENFTHPSDIDDFITRNATFKFDSDVQEEPWQSLPQIDSDNTIANEDDDVKDKSRTTMPKTDQVDTDDISENDANDELVPLVLRSHPLIIKDTRKLAKKYRYVQEEEWQSIRNRKYRVECPACKRIIKAEDSSVFIKTVCKHTKKHKQVDEEELIEKYDKELDYDLIARCIKCEYICKTKYYTVIGAFKSLWTHEKNKHNEHKKKLSHADLDDNIKSNVTKKYLMIRKSKIKQQINEEVPEEPETTEQKEKNKIGVKKTIKSN